MGILASDRTSPRVLSIDLDGRAEPGPLRDVQGPRPFAPADAALARVGARSGTALALALLVEHAARAPGLPTPLVISVGACVRRGLPTAARAGVTSRAPLNGRLADGQVGGDLGRRLASVADALVLRGTCALSGAVLIVRADGSCELAAHPELLGASPRTTLARLEQAYGAVACLCIGPGGERRLPFASLVASGDVPHFVGRGGLGAVLARCGLKAVVIDAPVVAQASERELAAALGASARLEGRARGGTLELFAAHAARGGPAVGAQAPGSAGTPAAARRVGAELAGAARERHGCAGCPTPCGWVFERPAGRAQPARFGATYSLGLRLGLERADDALALLARCDEAGIDAKEVGAGLALLCMARERGRLAGGPLWGRADELEARIDELLAGRGQGALLAEGAAHLASVWGLERELDLLRGGPTAAQDDVAAHFASRLATRGGDPQRAFPFCVHDGVERARIEALVAPLALPPRAEDPRDPAGKGRLVWWHENLSAALDASGFCAFSAAALLADGLLDLDGLARWIAAPGPGGAGANSPGERLVDAGAELLHLARRLEEAWVGPLAPPAAGFEGPWDDYARLRGLDEQGRLTRAARARFECGEAVAERAHVLHAPGHGCAANSTPAPSGEPSRGRVALLSSGALGEALEADGPLELLLPAALGIVLRAAAARSIGAAGLLGSAGQPLAAVYRRGARLQAGDLVYTGDELELLLVISGGAR